MEQEEAPGGKPGGQKGGPEGKSRLYHCSTGGLRRALGQQRKGNRAPTSPATAPPFLISQQELALTKSLQAQAHLPPVGGVRPSPFSHLFR